MMLGEGGGVTAAENEILAGIDDSGGGSGGGNRWPRQETLALLKIRSDMDTAFRDSSLKGPLWDEVSRKLAELGFQRSAKKCKEKFENVFKYHKRTKDGRQSKADGKSYRFFDQLEALENSPPPISFTPPPQPRPQPIPVAPPTTTTTTISPMPNNIPSPNPLSVALPQTASENSNNPIFNPTINPHPQPQIINAPNPNPTPTPQLSNSTSSSTSSDEDIQMRRGQKRKWKDFFDKMMKEVIYKQEEMQKKFLETLEKREKDRITKEESWRVHEMARMNREHEILVQERSVAAAKDAAVIAFLQKVTEQHNLQIPISTNAQPAHVPIQVQPPIKTPQPPKKQQSPPPPPPQQPNPSPPPPAPPAASQALAITPVQEKAVEIYKTNNGGSDSFNLSASSSRWPKTEVEALIKLRTDLEIKYQESGPKGPLWEEISQAMSKIGYNRSSKRCKEKWENINKYFKKVKESSKKRPEDSKTCPYFHQLDAIYSARAKAEIAPPPYTPPGYSNQVAPIMAQPEQQWPMVNQNLNPNQTRSQMQDTIMRDMEGGDESEDHDVYDEGDEEEEEDEGRYEIVTNKQPSSVE